MSTGPAGSGGGSKTEDLRTGLARIVQQHDDAVTSLNGAKRAADDAYDHFMGLGGSADRAQAVVELVTDLHRELTGLEGFTDEVSTAIDEVDHAITPEENVDKLDTVLEKLATVTSETDAVIDSCDDLEREIHQHLRGSDRADDIADQVTAARDELDQTRAGIDGLTAEARAQQMAYRAQSGGGAGTGTPPAPPPPTVAAPAPERATPPSPGTQPFAARQQRKADQSRRRAERLAASADQPLENPLPKAARVGHGHARHGHQTTEAQQALRVSTGIAPDGVLAPTRRASHFRSPEAEAEALGRARRQLHEDLRNGIIQPYVDHRTGEESFVHPTTGEPKRHALVVRTTDPRGFGDSAQVARRVAGPGTPYLKDSAGNLVPERVGGPRMTAFVVFEYVQSLGAWRELSYYPEA